MESKCNLLRKAGEKAEEIIQINCIFCRTHWKDQRYCANMLVQPSNCQNNISKIYLGTFERQRS